MQAFFQTIQKIVESSGFVLLFQNLGYLAMILVACGLLYLAIVKKFEPLLLLPIAFGMLMANLPGSGIIHMEFFVDTPTGYPLWEKILQEGGLGDLLYLGVKLGIYPPLIFLGIGTMTDFGPLISNPKSLLLGAAAQLGIFFTYVGAILLRFQPNEAAAISIIGGADGPTAIFVTGQLAPGLLGSIAVAAYSYMALVPVIQPPIMRLLTTKEERKIQMRQLRTVSKTEKIVFPILCTIVISLILPQSAVLVGMLMLGNLMKESGVVERIAKTAGNELMNIIGFFRGMYHQRRHIFDMAYTGYYFVGAGCVLCGHRRRSAAGQTDVLAHPWTGKSLDWCRWCFGSAYGSSCCPKDGTRGKSTKLFAHARYGPQCGWGNWLCCGGRNSYQSI